MLFFYFDTINFVKVYFISQINYENWVILYIDGKGTIGLCDNLKKKSFKFISLSFRKKIYNSFKWIERWFK